MRAEEGKPEEAREADGPLPMPEASFMTLVAGLSTQVLMNLGEFPHPVSGKKEKDLDHAKYTIDLLGVIKEKTHGNLSAEEQEAIDITLYELRMKYVVVAGF